MTERFEEPTGAFVRLTMREIEEAITGYVLERMPGDRVDFKGFFGNRGGERGPARSMTSVRAELVVFEGAS